MVGSAWHVSLQGTTYLVVTIHTRNSQMEIIYHGTAFKLVRGLSYQKFLSINEAPATKRQKQIPADFNEKLVIKMQRIPESLKETPQQTSYGTAPVITGAAIDSRTQL